MSSPRLEHPRELLAGEALEEIELTPSEWHRSRAMRGLARHLNRVQLSRAAALALRSRRAEWRAASLAAVALHSEEPGRTSVLAQALAAARMVSDLPRRLWLLLLTTPSMTSGELAGLSPEVMSGLRLLQASSDLASLLLDVPDPWLEQAAQLAAAMHPAWIRAETWAALAERMDAAGRGEWADRAVEAAREVTDPPGRTRALSAVLRIAEPSEREGLAWAALDAAHRMQDEGTQSVALGVLAGALSADQEPTAWVLANSMGRQELRVPALARLASRWRGDDQQERIRASVAAWGDTPDEWAKSSAIARIWESLPEADRASGLAVARSLRDPWARADLLGFLAGRDSTETGPSILNDAVAAARAGPSPWARSRALTDILDHTQA